MGPDKSSFDDPVRGLLPPLVVVVGPTASGKTELALELAERLGCEIVGADSRQVYRRLDIGTAKPTREQRERVPHHLVDHVEPTEDYQAWRYQVEFRQAVAAIAARGRRVLAAGGTGLYLRAGIEGLSEAAPRAPELRATLEAELDTRGPEALHARLAQLDPHSASRLHPRDRARVVRALEICVSTGRPAALHLAEHRPEPLAARTIYLGLDWPREQLYERIEQRTEAMLRQGWIDEVQALLAAGVPPHARAMQSLGYRAIVACLQGHVRREELAPGIAQETRRYAKRQLTWFRALPVHWLPGAAGHERLLQQALEILEAQGFG